MAAWVQTVQTVQTLVLFSHWNTVSTVQKGANAGYLEIRAIKSPKVWMLSLALQHMLTSSTFLHAFKAAHCQPIEADLLLEGKADAGAPTQQTPGHQSKTSIYGAS